jgi:hypothetical protein
MPKLRSQRQRNTLANEPNTITPHTSSHAFFEKASVIESKWLESAFRRNLRTGSE